MSVKPGPEVGYPMHDDVVQFVREHSRPFVETSEVSEQFPDTSRRTVYNRLQDLVEDGELQKRKLGGNTVVWWDTDHSEAASRASLPASESQ